MWESETTEAGAVRGLPGAAQKAHALATHLPRHPVAIGVFPEAMLDFGVAVVLRQEMFYRLMFPLGIVLSTRDFEAHVMAVETTTHYVWARLTADGHEIVAQFIMTHITHDAIHLCAA